jgi:hypothetical protein
MTFNFENTIPRTHTQAGVPWICDGRRAYHFGELPHPPKWQRPKPPQSAWSGPGSDIPDLPSLEQHTPSLPSLIIMGRAFFVKPRVLGSSDGGIAKARKRSWCIPMSVSLPNEVPSHRRNPIPRFPSVIWRTGAIDERGSPHMAVLSLVLIALGSGDLRRIPGQPLSLDRSRPPDYH